MHTCIVSVYLLINIPYDHMPREKRTGARHQLKQMKTGFAPKLLQSMKRDSVENWAHFGTQPGHVGIYSPRAGLGSVDGKLLRGDIKGRGILAQGRPGDQISRLGGFLLQVDWAGWRQGAKNEASRERGLRGACLQSLVKEKVCSDKQWTCLLSIKSPFLPERPAEPSVETWWHFPLAVLCSPEALSEIPRKINRKTEIGDCISLYAQLHSPSGIHQKKSQNLSSFLVVSVLWP